MKKLFATALALFFTSVVSGSALASVSPTSVTGSAKAHHHYVHKGPKGVPGKSTIKG